jgi:hypothetical protein
VTRLAEAIDRHVEPIRQHLVEELPALWSPSLEFTAGAPDVGVIANEGTTVSPAASENAR